MNEKLRSHFDLVFENAPKTRKAFELKEELLANSEERYNDLFESGISPDNAYTNVVNSIGNVSELFKGLEEISLDERFEKEGRIKELAIIKTVAVGLYLFSAVVLLMFNLVYMPSIGFIIMILIDIIPTCMLVYSSSIQPKYNKKDDTVVENFKEWKSETHKNKSIKGAVIAVLWTVTVLLYFSISFATWYWQATWILFLVAICAQAILELLFRLKELK